MWSGLCTTLVLQSRWESSSMHFTYFSSFLIALGFNWNVTSDPAARNRQITRYCHNSGPFVIFLSVPRFHPYIVFPIPPMPPRPERFFVGWGGGLITAAVRTDRDPVSLSAYMRSPCNIQS